jgi:hypothetical protein
MRSSSCFFVEEWQGYSLSKVEVCLRLEVFIYAGAKIEIWGWRGVFFFWVHPVSDWLCMLPQGQSDLPIGPKVMLWCVVISRKKNPTEWFGAMARFGAIWRLALFVSPVGFRTLLIVDLIFWTLNLKLLSYHSINQLSSFANQNNFPLRNRTNVVSNNSGGARYSFWAGCHVSLFLLSTL